MSSLQLDDGVRALLVTKLDSYEKLEIMRVLRGAGGAMSRSGSKPRAGRPGMPSRTNWQVSSARSWSSTTG